MMACLRQVFQSDEGGGRFEGVSDPKDLVDEIGTRPVPLQFEERSVQAFDMVVGLFQKKLSIAVQTLPSCFSTLEFLPGRSISDEDRCRIHQEKHAASRATGPYNVIT